MGIVFPSATTDDTNIYFSSIILERCNVDAVNSSDREIQKYNNMQFYLKYQSCWALPQEVHHTKKYFQNVQLIILD